MINATIAFDNKKHVWKTRYSFLSSCYACLDNMFFSSPKNLSTAISSLWEHSIGDLNNHFYGDQYQSSIAVTFNNHSSSGFGSASPEVSSNKVYKSFSLEGTTNMVGANSFLVNNSSQPSQLKTTNIGELQEKGGLLYGHIGQEQKISGANVKLVGRILNFEYANDIEGLLIGDDGQPFTYAVDNHVLIAMKIDLTGGGIPSSKDAKFSLSIRTLDLQRIKPNFYYIDDNGVFGANTNFADITIPFESYRSRFNAFSFGKTPFYKNGYILMEIDLNNEFHVGDAVATGIEAGVDLEQVYATQPSYIFAMTPPSVNGDSPKGQYADAVVNLGSNDFELFALNVEFETTDYSHSGEVKQ